MSESATPGEPMIQCPICKNFLPAGSRFCPNDGTPLTETAALSGVPTPTAALPSLSDMELPTVVGGRYRLVAVRGGGGMARVYQAIDQTLERQVAVKLINPQLRADPEFDARFQREARIASKLHDPHIVVVHDFGLDPAHGPFLVMEFLEGESLREHLHSKGPLPFKAALQMAGQLFLALIHAHGQGIIHRDIKPDNLFLMSISGIRLHVRVLDFGIARIMNREAAGNAQLTTPGSVLGTPRYMSPEQLAGLPLDARSDIYSAALVLFESLTCQLPHARGNKVRDLCPEVPEPFADLLSRCLDPNPDNRPSSALEAFLQLQEMGKASGVLLLPTGALERLAEARRQAQGLRNSSSDQETIPQAASGSLLRRRVLLGLLVLIGLVGILALLKLAFFAPAPHATSGPEMLLGVQIGDDQQTVADQLDLTRGNIDNPFALPSRPTYLGHALKVEHLGLPAEDLARLDVRRSRDDGICVLFHAGKVRALIVRDIPAGISTRGVAIGGSVSALYDRYPEQADTFTVPLPREDDPERRNHVTVHCYDRCGIAFETYGSKITAITLYPKSE